ncbi:MAG: SUMF1/EgtB/PvdO family nonheme iron enzyme [Bacteroidales bacterium]|nr:SUMF1/EgtB/PvdO family nonheme iron enzyme [Bacteroidales bacterium]
MKKQLTILILLITSVIASYGQTEKRLALVVGNSKYIGKGNSLRNPVNDAIDVAIKLKALGFDVDTLLNASLLDMDDAIDDFGRKAKDYDIALFYYSGHGLQSKGSNYMVPVDAEMKSEAEVKYKCTPVNMLLDKLDESGCPMKLIVLDACRNNPFERSWHKSTGVKGLSLMDAPKGTLISYATSPGCTAEDGTGCNSPYTKAFLDALDIPNLQLLSFFNEVGTLVQNITQEEQIPWMTSSALKGSFCFKHQPTIAQKQESFLTEMDDKPCSLSFTVNGVSFVMKRVEGGTFWMGAQRDNPVAQNYDEHALENEKPVHSVTLNNYYIGETEVTQALWKAVMKDLPPLDKIYKNAFDKSVYENDSLPVEYVSWNDCQRFIEKINYITGKTFRLPTEEEWEFAAKGGNLGKGYKYPGSNNLDSVAQYRSDWFTKHPQYRPCIVYVKARKPNELGIYDMMGNVAEWCNDKYKEFYGISKESNSYCVRGGHAFDLEYRCRISSRGNCKKNRKYKALGFRLALSE